MSQHAAREARIGRQAIWLVMATVAAQGVFGLVYVIAARGGTAAEFGAVAAAAALGTACAGYLDFGSNALWVRELARGTLSRRDLSNRIATKNMLAVIFAVTWIIGALLLAPSTPIWVAATSGLALVWSQSMQVPLRGAALIERVAFTVVVDRLIVLVALLVLLVAGLPLSIAFGLSLLVGPTVAGFLTLALTPRAHRPSLRGVSASLPWRGSAAYGVSSVAVGSQSLDMTILAATAGPAATGLYAAVSRWTQPIGMLANAFASVSIPHVAGAHDWHTALAHAKRSAWLLLLGIAGAIMLALAAPLAVQFLLGDQYAASSSVLRVLSIAMIPALLNQPMATFLQARGKDKNVSVVVTLGVIFYLAAIALLGGEFAAIGSAYAFLAMQSATMVALSILLVRGARANAREVRMKGEALD